MDFIKCPTCADSANKCDCKKWSEENEAEKRKIEVFNSKEFTEEFSSWYQLLLRSSMIEGKFGDNHALGSCTKRDIVRNKKVKEALKESYYDVMYAGEDVDE